MTSYKIEASEEDIGKRIDKFIFDKISQLDPGISRSRVKTLMGDDDVLDANSKEPITHCAHKIKGDEEILVNMPAPKECEIVPQDIDFEVIFEDEHMMVINKPAGLITHPGNGAHDKTLVNALLFKVGDNLSGINGVLRPGIVHRLDKDTSGLMVVAKSDVAHKKLASQIEDRSLKRNYLALVYGVPNPVSGRINRNIDRSRKNRLKMTTVKIGGKTATTNYEVKEVLLNGLLSLVECRLDTGRTHQIRVHMDEIGYGLIGDRVYRSKRRYLGGAGEELANKINEFPRQFLHSYKIAFKHPVSRNDMSFEIPLASDLEQLLSIIKLA